MSAHNQLETDAVALVAAIWAEFGAPPPILTVTEWAEQFRVLSPKDSSEPGPYRIARTPYAREPQDCLSTHSNVEEVVLMWGAQTSKTTIGSNWAGYVADVAPGPMMIVQPTIDMAKRYSRQRLTPMIDCSPVLARKVRENRSRDDANTTLLKEYPGGQWALAGANAAAGLRSMPVRDLFLDEIDAYPKDVDGEGDPIALAEARQSTFARRKRLKTSTPTTKDMSAIEREYLASDRCKYWVPCPHCGEYQVLEWGAGKAHGIKWNKDQHGNHMPETAHYVCRHTGCIVQEHSKPGMLAAGQWRAENPGAKNGKTRGFQLSSLYSPLGWLSWGEIAGDWLAAIEQSRHGDQSKLRAFVNTRLAETFEEDGDKVSQHELAKRAQHETYELRTVPWGCFLLVAGVDVQGDRIESRIKGYGRGEESWTIDRAIFYGDPAKDATMEGSPWKQLDEYLRTPIQHASGRNLYIMAAAIDSGGHHTQAVYNFTRQRSHRHIFAIKGQSQASKPILGKPSDVQVNLRGQKIKGHKLWPVGTDTAKALIYGRMRLSAAGAGYMHFSRQLPADEFEQLTAERLVTKYVKGHARLEWHKPPGRRNEALDCEVYALAAAYYLGMARWKENDWAKWERAAQMRQLFDAPADPPPAATPDASESQPAQKEIAQDHAQGIEITSDTPLHSAPTAEPAPTKPAAAAAPPPRKTPPPRNYLATQMAARRKARAGGSF
jgi:phage terminase large subunit GpA-like protein